MTRAHSWMMGESSVMRPGYGWKNVWFEARPGRFQLRKYIAGPYDRVVALVQIPYLVHSQQDPKAHRLGIQEGIPDPFARYLIYNSLPRKYVQRHEMLREDMNIVRTLRKQYRLYIGQGIPTPALIDPYADMTELCDRCHPPRCHRKPNDRQCFCCEKKYLFQCPDQCAGTKNDLTSLKALNCKCETCHVPATKPSELCEACALIRTVSEPECRACKRMRHQREEIVNEKVSESCRRPQQPVVQCRATSTEKPASLTDTASTQVQTESFIKSVIFGHETDVDQTRTTGCGCCAKPRRRRSSEGSVYKKQVPVSPVIEYPLPRPIVRESRSKIVQTDFESSKSSKEIQTDESDVKPRASRKPSRRCECTSKCFLCHFIKERGLKGICPNLLPYQHLANQSNNRPENECQFSDRGKCAQGEPPKGNQKMYYCTFTHGPRHASNKAPTNPRDPFPPAKDNNNHLMYHYSPQNVKTPIFMDYFNTDDDFSKKGPVEKSSKDNAYDPIGLKYDFSFGRAHLTDPVNFWKYKKYQRGNTDGFPRPSDPVSCNYNTFRHEPPVLVKYLNKVQRKESDTYGLVNYCKDNPKICRTRKVRRSPGGTGSKKSNPDQKFPTYKVPRYVT